MFGVWTAEKWGPLPFVWWLVIGLAALGGLIGLGNGLLNRVYRPVDGLVMGVVGRMGSGKSLLIVSRVLLPFCRALAKRGYVLSDSGRPMRRAVTNFRFSPGFGGVEIRNVTPSSDRSIFAALIELANEIGESEGPWYDAHGIMHDGREALPLVECPECDGTGVMSLGGEYLDGEPGPVELVTCMRCEGSLFVAALPELLPNGAMSHTRQPILNALVVLDEMHLFANSSKLALGDEASYFISMARKYNAEVWWASQHEMKVHKRLRDESSSIWLAGKLSGPLAWLVGSGWHMAKEYHSPALVERARNSLGSSDGPRPSDRRIYRFTKHTKRFYNSFELLVADPSPRYSGGGGPKRSRPVAADPGASDEVVVVDDGATYQGSKFIARHVTPNL